MTHSMIQTSCLTWHCHHSTKSSSTNSSRTAGVAWATSQACQPAEAVGMLLLLLLLLRILMPSWMIC
jgi:hypothetical protein